MTKKRAITNTNIKNIKGISLETLPTLKGQQGNTKNHSVPIDEMYQFIKRHKWTKHAQEYRDNLKSPISTKETEFLSKLSNKQNSRPC